jgi:hypothetical protein
VVDVRASHARQQQLQQAGVEAAAAAVAAGYGIVLPGGGAPGRGVLGDCGAPSSTASGSSLPPSLPPGLSWCTESQVCAPVGPQLQLPGLAPGLQLQHQHQHRQQQQAAGGVPIGGFPWLQLQPQPSLQPCASAPGSAGSSLYGSSLYGSNLTAVAGSAPCAPAAGPLAAGGFGAFGMPGAPGAARPLLSAGPYTIELPAAACAPVRTDAGPSPQPPPVGLHPLLAAAVRPAVAGAGGGGSTSEAVDTPLGAATDDAFLAVLLDGGCARPACSCWGWPLDRCLALVSPVWCALLV